MPVATESAPPADVGAKTELVVAPVPTLVKERIDRGRAAINHFEPKWHECLAFLDNEHYVELSAITGQLERLETREGGTKPRHRVRLTRNRFTPAIVNETSAMAARVPVWECDAINGDSGPVGAARLGEKALLSAYATLGVKNIALDMGQYAHTVGAGISWTRWNPNAGEFIGTDAEGKPVRQGEIAIDVFHQGEVLWEGDFYDARYWIVRKAQPKEEVIAAPGYTGPPKLTSDAQSAPFERRKGQEDKDLVYVYHYLERPSAKRPRGRWLQIVGSQLIADPADYPCAKDEPVLQWLPWWRRRHRNRPMGMGELMLDIQRTYNRTISQIVAYKNLVLNPQVFAPIGSIKTQLSEEPGAVFEFAPIAGMQPQWRDMPDLPVGLFKVLDQCIQDWTEITGQHQLPAGVDSGTGVQAIGERDDARRAVFMAAVADWYARLGMAILRQMQEHYTEDRLMVIQGRFGTEQVQAFKGTKLYGIAGVRVAEGSIAPRTKDQQRALIFTLVDKGLVDPKKAIMALNAGTADILIDDYELDVDKAKREIQQLVQMGLMQGAGVPMVNTAADNHQVHAEILSSWMKTVDFERQPAAVQQAAQIHLQWHQQEEVNEALRQQQMVAGQAEAMGAQNAAAPQGQGGAKPMPSQPSVESGMRVSQGTPSTR